MRTCVIGGGMAGTLLAWRLAHRSDVEAVDLFVGPGLRRDATKVSGGAVRAYESLAEQRRLAAESLRELRASAVLRAWSGYREEGSLYLRAGAPGLVAELEEVERLVPGSVQLLGAAELAEQGWGGLEPGVVGVAERRAGYVSPPRFRAAVLSDLSTRPAVTVSFANVDVIALSSDGAVACTAANRRRVYDIAVLAAGPWTPALMTSNGFDARAFRTKAIEYSVYTVAGAAPPPFVDETTGLYGRPTALGDLLLGLATQDWDVRPGYRDPTPPLHREAARTVAIRRPGLTLLARLSSVNATDCYCEQPVLSLRPVSEAPGTVWTFTGGSGGSVKTALAASREAADRLVAGTCADSSRNLVSPGA